jgi:hypothetical protein
MTKDKLLPLIERVEQATGPDRELDCLIWIEVGSDLGFDDPPNMWALRRPVRPRICVMGMCLGSALEKYPEDVAGVARNWNVPHLSSSIDAAMTLVPEGWRLDRLQESWRTGRWNAVILKRATPSQLARFDVGGQIVLADAKATGATPALALLAACLRAHSETSNG